MVFASAKRDFLGVLCSAPALQFRPVVRPMILAEDALRLSPEPPGAKLRIHALRFQRNVQTTTIHAVGASAMLDTAGVRQQELAFSFLLATSSITIAEILLL